MYTDGEKEMEFILSKFLMCWSANQNVTYLIIKYKE
jgi:hypothetical protein